MPTLEQLAFNKLLQNIPVGEQRFSVIRKLGLAYVDKTSYIYQLAQSRKPQLLTRPRRFGKSTLVSACEEAFLHGVEPYDGHESYFKGLELEQLWSYVPWNEGPFYVLHLDFWVMMQNCKSVADFEEMLNEQILSFAQNAHLELQNTGSAKQDAFAQLLQAVPDNSVVLLVDEYDSPLTTFFDTAHYTESEEAARVLRGFFSWVKVQSGKFRFVFITGISRLKDTSIFSAVNNITDISQDQDFGAICGITREELQRYFPENLRYATAQWLQQPVAQVTDQQVEQLLNELAAWYDGYCFSSDGTTHVFSLWSVLCFFSVRSVSFDTYWYNVSGLTQTLRKSLLKSSWAERLSLLAGDSVTVDKEDFLSATSLSSMQPEVLLFQTGYLTLKAPFASKVRLGVPNQEIKNALSRVFYRELLPTAADTLDDFSLNLRTSIETHDAAALQSCCNMVLHSVDYEHYPLTQESAVTASLYLAISLALLVRVTVNKHESLGRPDVLFDWQDTTVVIELKYAQTRGTTQSLLRQAVKQIRDRKYGETFDRRPYLWRLAMVFCAEDREITKVQVVS